MIKLFDFKFLILLGLTLVVYFMYKEIDYQRERILQCENQIKLLLETNPIQFHNDEMPQIVNEEQPKPKRLRPQLQHPTFRQPTSTKNPQPQPYPQPQIQPNQIENDKNLKLNLPMKMVNFTETSEKDIDNEFENKHIEVYSNDNENHVETIISDSLINNNQDIANTSNINIDTTNPIGIIDKILKVVSSTDTSDVNPNTSDVNDINQDTSDNKFEEFTNNINKDEQDSIASDTDTSISKSENNFDYNKNEEEQNNNNSKKSITEKKISKTSQSSKEELEEILKDLKIELNNNMNQEKVQKFDLSSLMKMKLPELQNLALKENITLDKKNNGISKKKTKQELAEEILEKKNI